MAFDNDETSKKAIKQSLKHFKQNFRTKIEDITKAEKKAQHYFDEDIDVPTDT